MPAYWVAKYLGRGFYKQPAAASAAVVSAKALFLDHPDHGWEFEPGLSQILGAHPPDESLQLPTPLPGRVKAEAAEQAALLRDVVGNTIRPVVADPAWLTPTVTSLAEAIYRDRAFDRLPILADALQDAGCDSPDLLAHLRGKGAHARGCWAVDLVLGRG